MRLGSVGRQKKRLLCCNILVPRIGGVRPPSRNFRRLRFPRARRSGEANAHTAARRMSLYGEPDAPASSGEIIIPDYSAPAASAGGGAPVADAGGVVTAMGSEPMAGGPAITTALNFPVRLAETNPATQPRHPAVAPPAAGRPAA